MHHQDHHVGRLKNSQINSVKSIHNFFFIKKSVNIPELFCSFPQRYCNEFLRVIDGRFIAATEKNIYFGFFKKIVEI